MPKYECEWCSREEENPAEDIKEVWKQGAYSCCYYRAMINQETGETYGYERIAEVPKGV